MASVRSARRFARGERLCTLEKRDAANASADASPNRMRRTHATALAALLALWSPFAAAVDLQLTDLSDSGSDPTPAGGIVTYSISLQNNAGDTATDVRSVFDLPAGSVAVNLPAFCSVDAGDATRVVCSHGDVVGTLANGDPVEFQLQVSTQGMAVAPIAINGAVGSGAAPAASVKVPSIGAPFISDTNTTNNKESQTTTLTTAGDLQLTKTANADPVVAGSLVTYTIAVRNNGPSASSGFSVADTLPSGVTFVGPASGAGWTFNGANGTYAGSLANGATATYSFTARVTAASGTIVNSAAVNAGSVTDPIVGNNTDDVGVSVVPGADMEISKTASPMPAVSGQPITFTLTTLNRGPSPAANVSFTDTMPAGFLITGGSQPAGWTCSTSADQTSRTCSRTTNYAVNATDTFTIEAMVPSSGQGSSGNQTNTATVSSSTADPVPANNTGSVSFTVLADGADLELASKTKSPGIVAAWGGSGSDADSRMTSTIRVRNRGPRPVTGQLEVADTLAPGEEYLSSGGPWSCVAQSPYAPPPAQQVVVCSLDAGSLPLAVADGAGNPLTPALSLVTRARVSGTLTNNACTGGSGGSAEPLTSNGINVDGNTSNDCTGAGVRTTDERADLRIAKTTNADGDADNTLPIGYTGVDYTLTVFNDGPNATAGIVVNDQIPGYINGRTTATVDRPAGWSCNVATNGSVDCRSNNTVLNSGASAVLTVRVTGVLRDSATQPSTACAGTTLSGIHCGTAGVGVDASIAGAVGEINTANNFDSDWVRVPRVANVRTRAKAITSGAVGREGVNSVYRVDYDNQGPSTAMGVVFRDVFTLPASDAGFVLISASRTTGGSGSTACVATASPEVTVAAAAGGNSYSTSGASGTVAVTCPSLNLANGAAESLNLTIRPNNQPGGSSGRQFDNTAGFSFTAASSGTDGNGEFNYNMVATAADDEKSASLTFQANAVDLITNKIDTGFSGGVDPLGYDPTNPPANVVTYRVTVGNQGPSVANNVRIRDTMTPQAGRTVTFLGTALTAGGALEGSSRCSVVSGSNPTTGAPLELDCLMPGIGFGTNVNGVVGVGQTSTVYLRYRYDTPPGATGDTISNVAVASSDEADTQPGNNSESENTTIRSRADMAVSKTMVLSADADPAVALPAPVTQVSILQPFFYVIEAVNNGPGSSLSLDRSGTNPLNGTGTVVTDTLPNGVVVTGPITWEKRGVNAGGQEPNGNGQCTRAGNVVTCNLGDVTFDPGERGRVRILVPARWDNVPAGGTSNNSASVQSQQVDPVTGNNNVTVPLGVTSSSLAGTVFEDRDRTGANGGTPQAAAAEPRVANVTITLTGTDAYGNPVNRTTTTDANGDYSFANLAPSDATGYTITQTQPTSYYNGPVDPPVAGGSEPSLGGAYQAGATSTGNSSYTGVQVGADVDGVRYHFPEVRSPSLSGFVYVDNNFNNVRNPGTDSAIANATVELLDAATGALVATATTDANGFYQFTNLDPRITYTLREPLPAGQFVNRPSAINPGLIGTAACATGCTAGTGVAAPGGPDAATTDRISQIDLSTGTNGTEFNFGEAPNGSSLSGRVWLDADNDDLLDPTETGIAGVTVRLTGTDQNGDAVDRQVQTGPDGTYAFTGLLPGSYIVTEPTQPANTLNGVTLAGSTGGVPTDEATVPSAISGIALGVNQASTDNNFGEIPGATINGRVWYDNDDDGVIAGTETGIAGVTIELTGTDDRGQPVSLTTVTDATGHYSFPSLRPGTYTLTEPTQPADTHQGKTVAGTINGVPTGTATPQTEAVSRIANITLGPGQTSQDNNFGEIADSPDLVVSKSSNPARFTVNNEGGYTVTVRNIGPSPTAGVYTVRDRLPAGVVLVDVPNGNGWTCTGAAGADRFSCDSSAVIAEGATSADTIAVRVRVTDAVANGTTIHNAVLVAGGGEDDTHAPTPAELGAFDGDVTGLPVCDPAITQNACRLPTPVQAAASLSGTVWFDIGSDDVLLDGGDRRLQGWVVEVVDPATGRVVATTTTAADGSYRVPDLVPGVQWNVRFRDPDSGALWGFPVSGETASGPAAACDTAGALANHHASSCRNTGNGVSQLEVVLVSGENLPQQSLPIDPSGVVYDAVTRDPVPGSVVTLEPAGVCPGYDPNTSLFNVAGGGYRVDGNRVSMTVGNDGFYQFLFGPAAPASCEFRLTVTPPAGYTFQSQMIVPQNGTLTPPGAAGTTYAVQPQSTPPSGAVGEATRYFLTVVSGSGTAGIIHNHIPLDPAVAPGLVISKTGDRQTVEVGDTLLYTITIRQTAGNALASVNVLDRLPPGFTYIDGTARANAAAIADPLGKPGPVLSFQTGSIRIGEQIVLTYRVRVGVGSQQGDGINRAQAFGCTIAGGCIEPASLQPRAGAIASNRAEYRVRVTGGVFTEEGCVLGKVFVDCNNNHVQDREELGVPGVRMYFEDGTWMVSDSEGKYSYCGLPPKSHTLKVDASTLPVGSRLTTSSNRNLGDADSLFIDLKNGELHRADFIEGSCSNPVLEQVKARRTQGEVRAPETEAGQKPLRFDSKSPRWPRQGTDSSNQQPRIVEPRPTSAGEPQPGPDAGNTEVQP